MAPDQKKPLVLLCPLGMTGSIVTETIDALIWLWLEKEKGIHRNQLQKNRSNVQDAIRNVSNEFYLDVYVLHTDVVYIQHILPNDCSDTAAWISKLFETCDIRTAVTFLTRYRLATCFPKDPTLKPYEPEEWIVFPNIRFVAIPLLNIDAGEILTDIRTDTENRCFQCMLFGLHHWLSQLVRKGHYSQVHISMAGGRKTMSGYTMVSAMMFERMDESENTSSAFPHLSHVLTSDGNWEKPYIHQLPPDKYSLFEVPFFPMSDLIPALLKDYGVDFADIELHCEEQLFEKIHDVDIRIKLFKTGAKYADNLEKIQQAIEKLIRQGVIFRAIKHDLMDPLKQSHEARAQIAWRAIEAISVLGKERRSLPPPAPLNLSELLKIAIGEYQKVNWGFIPENFALHIPDGIDIDNAPPRELMNHVLYNLFKNSIDHYWEQPSGDRAVTVGLEEKSDDTFGRVMYFDNLGGIPREHRSKIFEYGYSTKTGGGQRGFGLYLCRMILRLYGGDLEYEDHDHNGTKGAGFIMSFPKTSIGETHL